MQKELINKKLTINCLSNDMIKCAIEKGYKLPCISIKQHYGKAAEFIINYQDEKVFNYELNILGDNNQTEYIYLMPA